LHAKVQSVSWLEEGHVFFKRSSVDRSEPKGHPKKFRVWITAVSLIVFGALLSVAIALNAQITQTEAELRAIGARITDLKDHEFNTMADYVTAYARVEPLLKDYDRKLQEYSNLCDTAQERDRQRRLINVQRLYNRYNPELWRNTSEIIELIRQINAVMKKEASVIRDMSSLPEPEQVQFWHEEFVPLLAQEHALRERLLLAGQRMSPEPTVQ
jgi:hypothetical protein